MPLILQLIAKELSTRDYSYRFSGYLHRTVMATNDQGDHHSLSGVHHAHRRTTHNPPAPTHTVNYMDHDLDLKVDNLAQAKDKAQLTATGAMSVVHVALLKEVLDQRKENNRYFSVALSLIIISLALQILAGILALIVSHLRSYYAKYKDDLIEDMFENLCCCSVVSNRAFSSRKIAKSRFVNFGQDVVDGANADVAGPTGTSDGMKDRQNVEDESTSTRLRCCGCYCGGSRNLSNYEYDILEMYDDWGAEHTELELLAAEADVQVPYLAGLLQDAKLDVQDLEASKHEMPDPEFNAKHQRLRQKLEELENKKDIFEDAQRKLAVSIAKGDILMQRSDSVRRNRVLKLASFWQQMINYVFYIVFILNAFITGIGIAGK